MTELGHGLDAINIETTATLQADGTVELVTPNDKAAKHVTFSTLPLRVILTEWQVHASNASLG